MIVYALAVIVSIISIAAAIEEIIFAPTIDSKED